MTDEMPPSLPDAERAAGKARFLADLAALAPALGNTGRRLLTRIVTPNWALEWSLAYWVGTALSLPADVTRELVLSNVYMLAFGRLADDLVDGDEPKGALSLAVALYHLWIRQYVRLFASTRPIRVASPGSVVGDRRAAGRFWAYFDDYMTQGLRVTLDGGPLASNFRSYTEGDFQCLAARGAPLKIGCAAACLLAGRDSDVAVLASVVDLVVSSVVLLDDEFDWVEDLEAGRYNAFVAYCSDLPQTDEQREANRQAVLQEIYLGQAARPYFDLIQERLQQALQTSRSIGCPGLSDFIVWYEREVTACGAWLAQEAKTQLRALVDATQASRAKEVSSCGGT